MSATTAIGDPDNATCAHGVSVLAGQDCPACRGEEDDMGRGMTDGLYARLRADARRIFGHARCTACGRLIKVTEDSVLDAREDLRDEGWVETVPWDGEDRTALSNWQCCE